MCVELRLAGALHNANFVKTTTLAVKLHFKHAAPSQAPARISR
jgi:hypothetical protein